MAHHITVLTRSGCHLCEAAEQAVQRVASGTGTPVEVRDVDSDADLRARYGDWVPVVFVDGRQHGFFEVDEERLRKALR